MKLSLLLVLMFLLSACGTNTQAALATPTLPMPTATPDARQLAIVNLQAQGTLEAMQATSQAIAIDLTSTAYAPTQHAIETATERAWTVIGWTATSQAGQTATAQVWTPTPNFTSTVEAAQASAQATALHGEAVAVELAMERERMMNVVQAVAPWAALAAVLISLLVMAFRWSKVRPVSRDERGDAPLLVIDGRVYDADRNPMPVADFSGKKPNIPVLTPPEMQAATTARDQMIDLATRGSQGTGQRRAIAQKMANQNVLPQTGQIRVLPPEQARPLLGDVIPGIVQDAIETDLNETGENHE